MRPRSLRAILAIFVAIFLAALIALGVATHSVTHGALGTEVDRRLATEVAAIVGEGRATDQRRIVEHIEAAQDDHDTADLYYMLVNAQGQRVAGKLRLPWIPPLGYSDFTEDAKVADVAHGRALTRRLDDGATLVVVSDNDELDGFDRLLFRVQLIGLGLMALILIGGALGITIMIGARMRAMQRTVDKIMAGDLRSRIPLDGSRSEFDQQAAAFNRMLDRIDDLMANVKHAAKDVTHELKSPLARLRGKVAALARHTEADPLGAEIAEVQDQIDEIIELFASLLRLWEIEGGHRRERFADVDLGKLAEEVGQTLAAVAEDAGQSLTVAGDGPVPVRGDVNLMRQMVVNLVENAIRHTPPGTRIWVETRVRDRRAMLIVRDTGPGIPAEAHDAVIRRFGRLEAEGKPAGQGLGLTLVDAIARLHAGSLTLQDDTPGLRAVVVLPLRA